MLIKVVLYFFFFFQAEDGIRDLYVTGVQTCALPIFARERLHKHGPEGHDPASAVRRRRAEPAPAPAGRRERLAQSRARSPCRRSGTLRASCSGGFPASSSTTSRIARRRA